MIETKINFIIIISKVRIYTIEISETLMINKMELAEKIMTI
jgi:hypothetical protein